ncbi:MAG: RNA polymerase sigma factor [Flavobacteriia bacterium]
MSNKEEISQLISDCVNNSRKAQEKLFKLFYGKMLYLCLRYHPDRDTAQEVVQEGFIKVFEKISSFDMQGSIEAWIRRIMVNTAIDLIRKNNKATLVELNDNHKDSFSDQDTEEIEMSFETNQRLALEAIQELSPAYRTVFNLYYVEDLTHKEIAEQLGISEGTSKSNLAKAKMRVKQIIEHKTANNSVE